MPDKVMISLIQAANDVHWDGPVQAHKQKAIEKHIKLIWEAKAKSARRICLQGIFYGPYLC